jgi:hypothetical protein
MLVCFLLVWCLWRCAFRFGKLFDERRLERGIGGVQDFFIALACLQDLLR